MNNKALEELYKEDKKAQKEYFKWVKDLKDFRGDYIVSERMRRIVGQKRDDLIQINKVISEFLIDNDE